MAERNSHGLSRYVPVAIREEVRRRCGFGCVICGAAWYDYEHFDPDFKDARIHNPAGMTLLCMQHNQRRERGTLSVETVIAANANPFSLRKGFSSEIFDFGFNAPEIIFASAKFLNCSSLISVNGFSIFSIKPPAEEGQPYMVSGLFSDKNGLTTLKVEDNVFSVSAENWDVECTQNRIVVRKAKGENSLVLRSEPPNRVVVEEINMEFEGAVIKGDERSISISPDGIHWSHLESFYIENFHVGIQINNDYGK